VEYINQSGSVRQIPNIAITHRPCQTDPASTIHKMTAYKQPWIGVSSPAPKEKPYANTAAVSDLFAAHRRGTNQRDCGKEK
jgi:hypothetical protein